MLIAIRRSVAACAVLALGTAAFAGGVETELQEIDFDFALSPGDVMLPFEQFDDQDGVRVLLGVTFELEAGLIATVTAENDSELPAPKFALQVSGFYTAEIRGLDIIYGFSGAFITDGTVGRTDGVTGSGRDFWDFGTIEAGGMDSASTTRGLDQFVGGQEIMADVMGVGGFSIIGSTDSTVVTTAFTGVGTGRLIYDFLVLPTGACCLPGGECVVTTEAKCEGPPTLDHAMDPFDGALIGDGVYQGDDTNCKVADCPQPGVCCLPDLTCVPARVVGGADCLRVGGSYQGDETDCTMIDCEGPMGACCLPDGTCLQVQQKTCAFIGGLYQGTGTTCEKAGCPQPEGACCFESGDCGSVTEDTCVAFGGTYQGPAVLCDDVECEQPIGACCLDGGTCVLLEQLECFARGGLYQGDGTKCATSKCPIPKGACCFEDGACVFLTEELCALAGGVSQGLGVTCASAECPQPTGACCFGKHMCEEVTQDACIEALGLYQGDGTACSGAVCPSP